jgi:ssDNA-binding Zn-finger/Zn-ribbon topoisomerase 1
MEKVFEKKVDEVTIKAWKNYRGFSINARKGLTSVDTLGGAVFDSLEEAVEAVIKNIGLETTVEEIIEIKSKPRIMKEIRGEVQKEKNGVRLVKDTRTDSAGRYQYYVVGPNGTASESTHLRFQAVELFEKAVAATLEKGDGDCPRCGGHMRSVKRGRGTMERYAKVCPRCGYEVDADYDTKAEIALKKVGVDDHPDHREGRIGVRDLIRAGL